MVQKLACPEKSQKSDNLQWERTTCLLGYYVLLIQMMFPCFPVTRFQSSHHHLLTCVMMTGDFSMQKYNKVINEFLPFSTFNWCHRYTSVKTSFLH